jgi:hypothetical protein
MSEHEMMDSKSEMLHAGYVGPCRHAGGVVGVLWYREVRDMRLSCTCLRNIGPLLIVSDKDSDEERMVPRRGKNSSC